MSCRYIFVDESGDFGFSSKSSRYITLCAIVTSNKVALERIPRRVRRQLKASVKMKPEFKFHDSDDLIKRKILMMFASLIDTYAVCLIADKTSVSDYYRIHKNEMYDRMCAILLRQILSIDGHSDMMDFYFDIRPRNKPKGREFDGWILNVIEAFCHGLKIIPPRILISRGWSERNRGLIVADFIAGAVQRKYEHDSREYYDLISNSISVEKILSL